MFKKIKVGANTALESDVLNLDVLTRPSEAKSKYIQIGIEHLEMDNNKGILPEIRVKVKAYKPMYGFNFFVAFHPEAPWKSTIIEGEDGENIFKDFSPKVVKTSLPYIVRIYALESGAV